ncbi:TonB family protein [Sphingomonas sp.]|uniref:TonB family protein n=1 Tax=Sphingomonas sp. TaxID=28214 RepID=UPI003D6CC7EC
MKRVLLIRLALHKVGVATLAIAMVATAAMTLSPATPADARHAKARHRVRPAPILPVPPVPAYEVIEAPPTMPPCQLPGQTLDAADPKAAAMPPCPAMFSIGPSAKPVPGGPTDPRLLDSEIVTPAWRAQVLAHLLRFQHYPAAALREELSGTVMLRLRVQSDGIVFARRVVGSSGVPLLDAAALELVDRAQPLPPLPDAPPGAAIDVVLPVTYRIAE